VALLIDKESKEIKIDWEDEIIKGTLIARDGTIVHPAFAKAAEEAPKPSAAPEGGEEATAEEATAEKAGNSKTPDEGD
jgi:NAD(P) transhydrogenase subunit alpha